ncbi:alpha/beta fold hydrolase [Gordonia sp. HY442]|uniref:alpha/beta fold hydrolase n=1 Tax=Gordonia zhenghanii TaxID=2911516 RepID=UPI001F2FC6F3|nr:alpha/beta fold hydrolase [Gordonia zhenghanii]MCF8603699.1 alpha/beta fold hydrolase [Gordonia zhenghanii]
MMIDPVIDRSLYPFTSRWFTSSAGRVHYVDEGSGRPIVFCHGSPTWSFAFRHVIRALRGQYRCIAVDHLGFGLSERPDDFDYTVRSHVAVLGELIDHLDLNDLIVVGHDWGGPIGLAATTQRSHRVSGVALTNTALWPIEAVANRAFSAVMGTSFMQRRILDDNLLIERVLLGRAGPDLGATEADHYRRVQPAGARHGLAVIPTEIRTARPLLAELADTVPLTLGRVPSVAVWGMRDKVFPARSSLPRLQAMFEDLEVTELGSSGHLVPEESPDALADAISTRFRP